jgi:hypothetical protein
MVCIIGIPGESRTRPRKLRRCGFDEQRTRLAETGDNLRFRALIEFCCHPINVNDVFDTDRDAIQGRILSTVCIDYLIDIVV